ncbi:glycosyltransferase [Clostridium sp. P21]|uniref:Glycosyltransferase n=1 Tax=Clostridium muellerianum TaxID=2716538 RepID=A0A7Y0EDB4_9CLOT|nr:glycosyltransferase [Clostridium muellerianum]NMM61281.1 glycosyltransferase [Clostridium muellerianum]
MQDDQFTIYKKKAKQAISDLINSNVLDQAKKLIIEYESIVDDDIEICSFKAVIAIMENKIEKAEKVLLDGIKYEENNFDLNYNLAYVYEVMKEYELSYVYYDKSIELSSDKRTKDEIGFKMKFMLENYVVNRHKTSIIILTYNNFQYTKQCIESIRKFTEKNSYEIIVVDNNSTDKTIDWLKQQNDIRLISNENNLGFPKGCNQGIEISTGDSILLLNNDTIVTPNWLTNLNKALWSARKIGAVGAITNSCSYCQSIDVNYDSIDEMIKFASKNNISDNSKWEERIRLVGFCMLIKKKVIDEIGTFDERFTPGNYEDDDYSYRILNAGYKLLLCKDTFIHHFGSVSFKKGIYKYEDLLDTNSKKFEEKWGFNSKYSSFMNRELVKFIDKDKDKKLNVLELGCGCGATLLEIKNVFKNANLYGYELNESSAKIAKKFADISTGKLDLRYEKEFFHYIIINKNAFDLKGILSDINILKDFLKDLGKIFFVISHDTNINLSLLEYNSNILKGFIGKVNKCEFCNIVEIKKLNDIGLYEKILTISESDSTTNILNDIVQMIDKDKKVCDKIINFLEFISNNNKITVINKIISSCIENRRINNISHLINKVLQYDKYNKQTLKNIRCYTELIGNENDIFDINEILNVRYKELNIQDEKDTVREGLESENTIDNNNKSNAVEEVVITCKGNVSKLFSYFGENSFIGKHYRINGINYVYIGNNSFIKDNCWLNIAVEDSSIEPKIIIKDGCQIGSRFTFSISNKGIIEKNVIIGPNVYISDCDHNYKNIGIPIMYQGITSMTNEITIGENSWIGVNCAIVGNVHVGKGCVIGANSYVIRDVPDYSVVVGSPAKIIKMYDTISQDWIRVRNDEEIEKVLNNRKRKPLISICIPTFNRAKELEKCLHSIYSQIGDDSLFEVFISNNNSTDNTEEIIYKYKSLYNNITYNKNKTNIGADKNIALTMEKSSGKYMILHGDDDYFKDNTIYQLMNIINTNKQSSLFFINVLSNENQIKLCKGINEFLKEASIGADFISGVIIKREEYEKVNEPFKFIDTCFNQIYLQYSILLNNPQFVLINSPLFYYEGNKPNGYNFDKVFIKKYLDILNYFVQYGLDEEIIKRDKQKILETTTLP